ncbi:hypothetical protein NEF87_001425 [Candidatus Lokiarchaeum ossiferum]|uniref:ABC3 transporter permease protein domain-containing protein n=1 Tax=Candidatus Lokiarchaeum ossiferum TaxID=2951803 RepID=A0ABY6HP04_9ARCH|nr:hypothetical protein NEF87_001425 [Candidatus Lokiarchaeum sp. B-35]
MKNLDIIFKKNLRIKEVAKYWKYYWNESLINLKKHWIIILCIGFSISMISGMAYFNIANQQIQFQNAINSVSDFDVMHEQFWTSDLGWEVKLDFYENFNHSDSKMEEIINSTSLDLEMTVKYGMLHVEEGFIVNKDWESFEINKYSDQMKYLTDINASKINLGMFDNNFYSSSRFSQFFKIIEGKAPENPNEILIDYSVAQKYSYKLNETINITTVIGSTRAGIPIIINLHEFLLENLTISGIYLPTKNDFQLDLNEFQYSYTVDDYTANQTYQISKNYIESPLFFLFNNFEVEQREHILLNMYQEVAESDGYNFMRAFRTFSGYMFFFNRAELRFDQIRTMKTQISQKSFELYQSLPFGLDYYDKLSNILDNVYREYQQTGFFLQFLNFPVILFAILISRNLVLEDEEKFRKKILNLKGKGMPIQKIVRQIQFNTLITGSITSLLGILFGGLTFYGYSAFLGRIYGEVQELAEIPAIRSNTIIFCFFLGIGITYLTNVELIHKIKKLKFSDLAESIGNGSMNNINESSPLNKITDDYRASVSKWAWIQIISSLIPVVAYLLLFISKKSVIPDSLVDIVRVFLAGENYILLLSYVGMGLIISAIIRIISRDVPKIFTNYSKNVSKVFVRDLNPMVSYELTENYKWSHILTYLAIYVASMTILNISFYSILNYEMNLETFINTGTFMSENLDASFVSLRGDFALIFGSSGFYKMIYINFIIVGIFLGIELGLTIIIIIKENSMIMNTLKNRGLKRKKMIKIIMTQVFIVFSLAIIIGVGIGLLVGVGQIKMGLFLLTHNSDSIIPMNSEFPIIMEFWSQTIIFTTIFLIVCLILLVYFFYQKQTHLKQQKVSEDIKSVVYALK